MKCIGPLADGQSIGLISFMNPKEAEICLESGRRTAKTYGKMK